MYCPECKIDYEDPGKRYCESCGKPLEGAAASSPPPDTMPRRKPRTTSPQPPETVVVQVGGRPRRIRRTYLLVFLLLLLLLLSCCCLLYTDILPVPSVVTDIFGAYTPVVPGCGLLLVLIFICYIIIILFKLDFNCIYIPVGLLIIIVLCVILNIIGVVTLPDWVDDIVGVVTDPIPWDPDTVKPLPDSPKTPDEEKPSTDCCSLVDVKNVKSKITNRHFVTFDLVCEGGWPVWGSQCITGTTEFKDNDGKFKPWTSVRCCPDLSDEEVVNCESPGDTPQKRTEIKVELEHGDCSWEALFHSVYHEEYSPPDTDTESGSDCPSGQSLCGSVCCNPSDCYSGECSP